MSKTYFIFSDVHGFYHDLSNALHSAGFDLTNPNHCIVSLGDLLDRGGNPMGCIQFVNDIPSDRKILIRGNHEVLLMKCLKRGFPRSHDYHNGTAQTITDLCEFARLVSDVKITNYEDICKCVESFEPLTTYMSSLVDYAELGDNIFLHSWFPLIKKEEEDDFLDDYPVTYDEARHFSLDPNWRTSPFNYAVWGNPFVQFASGICPPNKRVFCGHWGTYNVNKPLDFAQNPARYKGEKNYGPFIASGAENTSIVGLDATTVLSHTVNVYKLTI